MTQPNSSAPLWFRENVWVRNLIFLGVCLVGLSVATASLLQTDPLESPATYQPQKYEDDDFRAVVDDVDDLFSEHWQAEHMTSAPRAAELKILRRLSLGTTGAVPSLEEIRYFESQQLGHPEQWWLSRLFEDRRYSDYVAERLARAYVGTENGPFLVYRRRRFVTWLSDRLHENTRYDKVVRSLIADDGLWTDSPAVNFITVTANQEEENQPDEARLAGRTTRAFLGVRLDCMQCHDDRLAGAWTQQDFHQLAAFFSQAQSNLKGITDNPKLNYMFQYHLSDKEEAVPARMPFNHQLREKEGPLRAQLATWVTHPENKPFARTITNRVWALMFGQPLWNPIDNIPLEAPEVPESVSGMAASDCRVNRLRYDVLTRLADDFIAHDFDLQRLFRIIAATKVFQMDSQADFEVTLDHEKHHAVFPLTRLRPEQVAGALLQSASLETTDANSHIVFQIARYAQQNEFVQRYGDTGEDEFEDRGGTIPQRLLMMNGKLVTERTQKNMVLNASSRIAAIAPDDRTAVECAYLTILSRRPTPEELSHFADRLHDTRGDQRMRVMEDMCWTLLNSTEFCWNH